MGYGVSLSTSLYLPRAWTKIGTRCLEVLVLLLLLIVAGGKIPHAHNFCCVGRRAASALADVVAHLSL